MAEWHSTAATVSLALVALLKATSMPPRLIPVTDLKRKATEIIQALQAEREPLLITEHGSEAAILMDVASYRIQERKIELLEGIIRGQKAMTEGRIRTHDEVMALTAQWT